MSESHPGQTAQLRDPDSAQNGNQFQSDVAPSVFAKTTITVGPTGLRDRRCRCEATIRTEGETAMKYLPAISTIRLSSRFASVAAGVVALISCSGVSAQLVTWPPARQPVQQCRPQPVQGGFYTGSPTHCPPQNGFYTSNTLRPVVQAPTASILQCSQIGIPFHGTIYPNQRIPLPSPPVAVYPAPWNGPYPSPIPNPYAPPSSYLPSVNDGQIAPNPYQYAFRTHIARRMAIRCRIRLRFTRASIFRDTALMSTARPFCRQSTERISGFPATFTGHPLMSSIFGATGNVRQRHILRCLRHNLFSTGQFDNSATNCSYDPRGQNAAPERMPGRSRIRCSSHSAI